MKTVSYRGYEELTLADLDLLSQVYQRLRAEGYHPGFNFEDFLDIVTARGDYTNIKLDEWLVKAEG